MKLTVKILGIIYYITFQQLFNIIANAIWILRLLPRATSIRAAMKLTEPHSLTELKKYYKEFQYRYDGIYNTGKHWGEMDKLFSVWPTWEPLPFVFFGRGKKGNCDDAAVYAGWLFRKLAKHGYKYDTRRRIYTQIRPLNLQRTHYVLETSIGVFCNGNFYKDITAMQYAKTRLQGEPVFIL